MSAADLSSVQEPPSRGPNTAKDVLGYRYYLDANAFIELTHDPSVSTPMGFLYQAYVEGWIAIDVCLVRLQSNEPRGSAKTSGNTNPHDGYLRHMAL